jgi:3-dehydroquinate synthetase
MSEIRATLQESARGFHVAGQETIEFDLMYVDGVFMPANPELADVFSDRGRCLMVIDEAVLKLYGEQIWEYFEHHGIALTTLAVQIAETDKSLATVEQIVDGFGEFGLRRKEPVLVVGGGLTTDEGPRTSGSRRP